MTADFENCPSDYDTIYLFLTKSCSQEDDDMTLCHNSDGEKEE